jgi:hypothetical protein
LLATLSAPLALAGPASAAQSAHKHARPLAKAAARSPEELEARNQERATRALEREQARSERQAERAQRRATRTLQRAEKHAARPANCRVTIASSAPQVTAGEAVTISGDVSCPSGAEPAAQRLALAQGGQGSGTGSARRFAAPQSISVAPDGSYTLPPQTLTQNTVFKVRLGRHGAHVAVKVSPLVTLSVSPLPTPSTRANGAARLTPRSRASFTGTVTPAGGSGRVALQVQYPADGEAWRTIAFAQIQPDGSYSLAHGFKIGGEAGVRVIAHLRGTNALGVSEVVAYSIPQAQNPLLTLNASADPITYGQSVTLSGVAAGTPGQSVTLSERLADGSSATVGTAVADESGAYSFEVSPPHNTTYSVSDASTHSTPLFVGVRYGVLVTAPPSAVVAGRPLSVSGTVTPGHAGQPVYLERANSVGSGFHVVASATVNADSTFTLTHTFDESAAGMVLRVRVGSDSQLQRGLSDPFTVQVTIAPTGESAPGAEPPAS